MRGKKIHRLLSIMLVVVMLLSVMPAAALADGTTETSDDSSFYKIVHLDCGRKYFTKDWIIALINEMAADGYNQLQLAFGNDGLRFLLNDMSFTANSTTYSHADVVSAVETGNAAQNSSGDKSWLTEAEMDEIIAAANSKGIEIVPLLNLPGHANAILDIANDAHNVSGSNNTLDMSKTAAVNFGMAIFQKYVDYFAKKGCKFFSFGADEYANDISGGSFSFGLLNSAGYQSFVDFINQMAAYIEDKGMTPRAFNDGLYYGKYTSFEIDTKIECCYWSSGWNSYNVASASDIAAKGHPMINTHGDFYYVLGKSDKFDSGYSYAENWNNSTYQGSTISDSVGSMFCIWCDYPNAETETEIAANVRLTLRAMEARMDGASLDNLDTTTVVSGGFNADGSINKTSIQKDGTTVSNFTVKMGQTATLSLSDSEATATWSSSNENVATVTAMSRSVAANSVIVNPVGEGTATITAALSDGTSLTTEVTVAAAGTTDEPEYNDTIVLEVGEEKVRTINDYNYETNYEVTDSTIVAVNVTGTDATEATTTYTKASVTCSDLLSSNSNNWTAVDRYYYKAKDGNYYPVYAKRTSSWGSYTYTWGYSKTDSSSDVQQIGNTQSTRFPSYSVPDITVYTKSGTDGTPASTTVTFTGLKPGETTVRVGTVYYKVTVNYKSETVSLVVDGGSVTKTQTNTITDTPVIENEDIVAVSVNGNQVTFTPKALGTTTVTVGDTIYTVTVTTEVLEGKTQTIEYWITNGRPTDANGNSDYSVEAVATGVNSENGVAVASLLPENTTKEIRTLQLWRCRLLNTTLTNSSTSGTEKQTEDAGDDETYNGVEFTRIRYWNGTWSVYTEENEWVNVTSNHQLVAYYLEILPVSDEMLVTAADWGKKADGSTSGDYLEPANSCTVSVQVIYEDGTSNPAGTTAADLKSTTIAYGYWSSGRGIGTLILSGLEGYQIWKIEAETGAETYSSSSSTWGSFTVNSFKWDNNPMTVYEGEPVDSYILHNDAHDPSRNGYYQNLMWDENLEAILIKVYVKAPVTEDSLTVHYMDQTANNLEFYSYNISVEAGTVFNEAIALGSASNTLVNNTVKNILGVTQTVTADLSKMTEIGTQYRYSEYTCVQVLRSQDGKDVYLYYTFNNTHSFVIDFGLPLKITTADLGISGDWTSANASGAQYGDASATVGEGLTYTPNKVLAGVETLQLTLTPSTGTPVTHQIYIYPASNVLYEDTFLNVADGWTATGISANQAQSSDQDLRYGYDENAYSTAADYSNGTAWLAEGLSDSKLSTKKLTTSFYGNGFDLIGECAPDTAMVYLVIKDSTGKAVKGAIVDTRFADGNVNGSKLYQVPLAHLMLDTEGAYTAEVSAYYVAAPTASSNAQTASTFSMSRSSGVSDLSALYEILDAAYEDDLDLDDIDFLYFDESSPIASMNQAVAMYAAVDEPVAEPTATETVKVAGTRSVIDGFRVYRSSTNSAYLSTEKNVKYVNVLKAVTGNIAGYIEGNANGQYSSVEYEGKGGPQNEIYLPAGHAVTLQTNADKGDTVQISARAVSGTAYLNKNALNTNTEMYYEVTVGDYGVIVLSNSDNANGMLAIANLKLRDDTVLSEPTEATYAVAFTMLRSFSETTVDPEPEPDHVFTPDKLDIKVNSRTVIRNRLITVTITSSTDVAKLTVNGKTILPANALLVKYGRAHSYTYVFVDTVRRDQTKSYEIIAYNADGVASEIHTVEG